MKNYKKIGLNITKLITSTFLTGILAMCTISCEKTETIEGDLLESSSNSERVQQQNNLSGEFYIQSESSGQYLSTNGSNVVTRDGVKTRWNFVKDGTRSSSNQQVYKIIRTTGQQVVLDVEGRSTRNGANVHAFKNQSSNDNNQRWFVHLQVESGGYIISSENGGKALDRNTTGTADNRNVHMWNYGGNSNQRWKLIRP